MAKPFKTTISDSGVAEMILDHPPVNAFDSRGWFAIADEIDALGADERVRVIVVAVWHAGPKGRYVYSPGCKAWEQKRPL